jgi:hypothetical protein
MPRIFESKSNKEFFDSPNALITVTISGLTFEEYIRVRETYNREFCPDLYTEKINSSHTNVDPNFTNNDISISEKNTYPDYGV